MKKVITTAILVSGLFVGGAVFAQSPQVALPSAGLTPESSFYFLDRLGENLRQFFTFNPEAKAKLQIEFAGERIAEIKVIVEKGGVDAKGLAVAKSLLQANVAYAAEIVSEEKTSGKDVSVLAKTLDDKFDAQEQLLVQTFQDARKKLKEDRLALKKSLAEQAGDVALVASLEQQIKDLELQSDKLKDTKNEIRELLRGEREKIEKELNDEDQEADEKEEIEEDEQDETEEIEIEDEDKDEEVEKVEEQEAPEAEEPEGQRKVNEDIEDNE